MLPLERRHCELINVGLCPGRRPSPSSEQYLCSSRKSIMFLLHLGLKTHRPEGGVFFFRRDFHEAQPALSPLGSFDTSFLTQSPPA